MLTVMRKVGLFDWLTCGQGDKNTSGCFLAGMHFRIRLPLGYQSGNPIPACFFVFSLLDV